jgi:TonB family C-terminal domain
MKHIIFTFIIGIFCISVPMLSQKKDDFSSQAETIFDKAPVPIKRVEPKYPESMLKDSWESNVYLKVFVDIDGNVASAKIERFDGSSPNELQGEQEVAAAKNEFQEAACTAVKQWKFTPAQMQGKPVAVWITIPFRFKIYKDEKEQPKDNTSQSEMHESMLKSVEHILKGYDLKTVKRFINPEAYLIYGKYYESLHGVLNGERNKIKLIEGPDSKVLFSHFTMSDDKTTAYVILKTQIKKNGPLRFHTIVFMKTENSDWQILHWHVSF